MIKGERKKNVQQRNELKEEEKRVGNAKNLWWHASDDVRTRFSLQMEPHVRRARCIEHWMVVGCRLANGEAHAGLSDRWNGNVDVLDA